MQTGKRNPHDFDAQKIEMQLKNLGFPKDWIAAYLGLQQIGNGESKQVHDAANALGYKISESRVDAALKKLSEEDLIVVSLSSHPKLYVFPEDFDDSLEDWLGKRRDNQEDSLRVTRTMIASQMHPRADASPIELIAVGAEKDVGSKVHLRTQRMLRKAAETISIISSRFHWVDKVEGELVNKLRKGVQVEVLVSRQSLEAAEAYYETLIRLSKKHENFRLLNDDLVSSLRVSVVDFREVVVVIRGPQKVVPEEEAVIGAFYTDQVDFLKAFIKPVWDQRRAKASPISL